MKQRSLFLMFLLLSLSILPVCGGSGGDESGSLPTGPTQGETAPGGDPAASAALRVMLTDKPADDYLAVSVTITSVRVHQSSDASEQEGGWIEMPVTAAMPVDLLTLRNGVLYQLCQTQLPAGHYQQVRLVLAPNAGSTAPFNQSVTTADGVAHALDVPSGTIKIIHSLAVDAAGTTDLTLDFDASESVKERGNGTWFMQPVITAASSKAG